MFRKVLIVNRGVVVSRVARTLKEKGISWAAIYSDADKDMGYVGDADAAYPIGPATARQSYLDVPKLLEVIRRSGCDAVHPGYGFLSENAAFAAAVEEMGVRFIGPRVGDIADMGDKVVARRKMEAAGIPMLPASGPLDDDADELAGHAERIGFPMLVKAAAGGGGIGMQRVHDAAALDVAVNKTRQLSGRAFGNGTVYLERLLEMPRHVEFQMFGDGRGKVRHLFERDCSIQRRHQKVIEEAPAPAVDRGKCDAMAANLAEVLSGWNYASLGTVEMLLDRDGKFYFLEMNTRLQVEHGVTEAVTGLDLVDIQLRLAAGEPIDEVCPATPSRSGHAIEMRIYAEDPVRFLPSTGVLTAFQPPSAPGVRVETHLSAGNAVTPHYDPMLALLIVKGRDRDDAIGRAIGALNEFRVEGVKTNIPFLRHALASEEFAGVSHHTTIADQLAKSVA